MSSNNFKFILEKKIPKSLGRAGVLETPHGVIHTPAFVVVGTKGTVKALTPEQVRDLGAEVVLANTYHLYLQPGEKVVKEARGLHTFMNWHGPTMTDSGGFQAFSLGAAYESGVTKVARSNATPSVPLRQSADRDTSPLQGRRNVGESASPPARGEMAEGQRGAGENLAPATITEDGVEFRSHIDGSTHFFTPEKSIQIQHNIGADIIFAFDECTSPNASYEYQKEALGRTHRWAERSLAEHTRLQQATREISLRRGFTHPSGGAYTDSSEKLPASPVTPQALFGIVQGGRHEDLRKESAKFISQLDFDGFGIGGSFVKEDMNTAVGWVNKILPEEKPRHLLGIGNPEDLFSGIENGADLFDCVAPTRMARNGSLHTKGGRINILNTKFTRDFSPIDTGCRCYTCQNYTRAYLSHLFRAKEMLAATLASIHNLYFIIHLVKNIRQSILDNKFFEYKEEFLRNYL
ncbi:tRNA guanosine(34) transglycosylase Tgt [bacterium]|nr:tRNA guanosine(34) transglycosylase Tgt [bacterium]